MQHVVSQLITKKEELLGELKFYRTKVDQLEELLHGIDISIVIFDPNFDLKSIKPKRYSTKKQYFKHGEAHRLILDILRKRKEPLSTTQITKELMKLKKLDIEDQEKVDSVQKSLLNTLKKQEKDKIIRIVNKDYEIGFTWELSA